MGEIKYVFIRFEYKDEDRSYLGTGAYRMDEGAYNQLKKALERIGRLQFAEITVQFENNEELTFSSGVHFLNCIKTLDITQGQYESLVYCNLKSVNIEPIIAVLKVYMSDTAYIQFEYEDMGYVRPYPMDEWVKLCTAYQFFLLCVGDGEPLFEGSDLSAEIDAEDFIEDFIDGFTFTMIDENTYHILAEDMREDNMQNLVSIFEKIGAIVIKTKILH